MANLIDDVTSKIKILFDDFPDSYWYSIGESRAAAGLVF